MRRQAYEGSTNRERKRERESGSVLGKEVPRVR